MIKFKKGLLALTALSLLSVIIFSKEDGTKKIRLLPNRPKRQPPKWMSLALFSLFPLIRKLSPLYAKRTKATAFQFMTTN